MTAQRDYSLTGPEAARAAERGLAKARWYQTPLPREQLAVLMVRTDAPAIRDTLIWFAAFAITGTAGYLTWGSAWCIPCFAAYGVLYGSSSDSRWHECGHRTAFRTPWMNDAIYHLACFMILREPDVWRWSHTRHHLDTIVVGRDPEIAAPRPPNLGSIALSFLALPQLRGYIAKLWLHARGKLDAEEATYIPAHARPAIFRAARIHAAIHATAIGAALAAGSILPLMYVGLPSLYGAWLYIVTGLSQHAGLAEDVLDHRLNCRTVHMNRLVRFLYWNMNYHVEHHMFPMVPYHRLPELHEAIRHDTPTPYPSLWAAWREIIPTLLHQRQDPTHFVRRTLPTPS